MTEIDDEMVERAYGWSPKGCGIQRWQIRDMLTAALSAPKPEIEVSEGMKDAANKAWMEHDRSGYPKQGDWWALMYRAMESTRLKEAKEGAAYAAKSPWEGVSSGAPVKETGGGVAYVYWDKNDRRQNGRVVMTDRRVGDRRGRDRFAKNNRQQFYGMTRD